MRRGLVGASIGSRPRGYGGAANPSITITVQGVDAVDGVAEQFSVSGGVSEVVTFSDGTNNGGVSFDSMGNTSGATPPNGYDQVGSTGNPSMDFIAQAVGVRDDMAKTSGGGGDVTVTTQGADAVPGVAEEFTISFDGATGGTIRIAGSDPIAWDADAAAVEAALEAILGTGLSITGSNGEFAGAFDDPGTREDLTITENLLTK